MDSNTHSVAWLDRLAALETDLDQLATQPLDSLTDTALVEGALVLRRLAYRRLQVRYERRADILLGFLQLACALICLKQLNTPMP